jgi:hypothetical protein
MALKVLLIWSVKLCDCEGFICSFQDVAAFSILGCAISNG